MRQNDPSLQAHLDDLVRQYKTPAFIPGDPISFPDRFRGAPLACEITAFLAALFSYGRRELILALLERIFEPMAQDPHAFLMAFHPKRDEKLYQGLVYRFNRAEDLLFLIQRLQWVYREFGSLENLWVAQSDGVSGQGLQGTLKRFMDGLIGQRAPQHAGLKFLLPDPAKGGGCKRLHMFLRWMVRQDPDPGPIDFGLWRHAIMPSRLLIPLDTHTARTARQLGLTQRRSNDWKTAEEITEHLRRLCPDDPVKYDFALFGYGIGLKRSK